jgi:hypothetical protein
VSDILRALSISASILLPVVILIIVVGRAAVLRGEASAHGHAGVHEVGEPGLHGVAIAGAKPAPAAAKAGAAAAASEQISVLEILGMGTALFVLAVIILFGISLISHM